MNVSKNFSKYDDGTVRCQIIIKGGFDFIVEALEACIPEHADFVSVAPFYGGLCVEMILSLTDNKDRMYHFIKCAYQVYDSFRKLDKEVRDFQSSVEEDFESKYEAFFGVLEDDPEE